MRNDFCCYSSKYCKTNLLEGIQKRKFSKKPKKTVTLLWNCSHHDEQPTRNSTENIKDPSNHVHLPFLSYKNVLQCNNMLFLYIQWFVMFSVIPLGLIRDAHFTRNVPKYLNVGSLGLTLAHEILHSLDRMGRGFR